MCQSKMKANLLSNLVATPTDLVDKTLSGRISSLTHPLFKTTAPDIIDVRFVIITMIITGKRATEKCIFALSSILRTTRVFRFVCDAKRRPWREQWSGRPQGSIIQSLLQSDEDIRIREEAKEGRTSPQQTLERRSVAMGPWGPQVFPRHRFRRPREPGGLTKASR